MHYTFIDDKRVSKHVMKDGRTFLRLQEAAGLKQAKAKSQGYEEPQTMRHQQISNSQLEPRKVRVNQIKTTTTMEAIFHQKDISRQ
jgi:hypothetical protein